MNHVTEVDGGYELTRAELCAEHLEVLKTKQSRAEEDLATEHWNGVWDFAHRYEDPKTFGFTEGNSKTPLSNLAEHYLDRLYETGEMPEAGKLAMQMAFGKAMANVVERIEGLSSGRY
jgi:hypothetical protein